MKKYVLILIVLILVGVGLGIQFFTQDEKLDQTVFLETTESIRNLQALDKNLLLLLNQSRFDEGFDHLQIYELDYQISEEFDNLRYEALFEEIEKSAELSASIEQFEAQFGSREELLDGYEESNIAVAENLVAVANLVEELQASDTISSQAQLSKSFIQNDALLFKLALNKPLERDLLIVGSSSVLDPELQTKLNQYHVALNTISQNYPTAVSGYKALNDLGTGELLDTIEKNYVGYHNQAIGGTTSLRLSLIHI